MTFVQCWFLGMMTTSPFQPQELASALAFLTFILQTICNSLSDATRWTSHRNVFARSLMSSLLKSHSHSAVCGRLLCHSAHIVISVIAITPTTYLNFNLGFSEKFSTCCSRLLPGRLFGLTSEFDCYASCQQMLPSHPYNPQPNPYILFYSLLFFSRP
jgi:hypothetical protein